MTAFARRLGDDVDSAIIRERTSGSSTRFGLVGELGNLNVDAPEPTECDESFDANSRASLERVFEAPLVYGKSIVGFHEAGVRLVQHTE